MDIPFLGATVGWRNYKLVSKKELGIVPILGDAIRAGGNIMVDRTDRKSQLKTLKQGINYLKKVRSAFSSFVCNRVCKHDMTDRVLLYMFPPLLIHDHRKESTCAPFQKEQDLDQVAS